MLGRPGLSTDRNEGAGVRGTVISVASHRIGVFIPLESTGKTDAPGQT